MNLTENQIKDQIAVKEAEFAALVHDQKLLDAETKTVLDAYNAKTTQNNARASEMRGYVAALQGLLGTQND